MKHKKIVAFLAAAALLAGSTVTAFGAAYYNTWDWDLTRAFTGRTLASPWATYDYDYGTTLPNDDVRAQSHMTLGYDMKGFAYVKIYGTNGQTTAGSSTTYNNGSVHSGWIALGGCDYASEVNYIVRRTISGALTEYNDTVR